MHVDKADVAKHLRSKGAYDRAQQAECALPRRVDTERDAALLHNLDIDVAQLGRVGDDADDSG